MEGMTELTAFLGWCTLINIGLYAFTSIVLLGFREPIKKLHASLTGVPIERLNGLYFSYLANYKIALIVFNLVPYLALRMMS